MDTGYFYQNGDAVKVGDIVFYSEYNGDEQSDYADCIYVIQEKDGDYLMSPKVFTSPFTNDFEEVKEAKLPKKELKVLCDKSHLPNTCRKIGSLPKDRLMLSKKHAYKEAYAEKLKFR